MNKNQINVYSEIGELKKVLIHTPGNEIKYLDPFKLDQLLFSAILNYDIAVKEHKQFVDILKKESVDVVELVDLCAETYDLVNKSIQKEFIKQYIKQGQVKPEYESLIFDYLFTIKDSKKLIANMMAGVFFSDINIQSTYDTPFVINGLPNLYFTRDPFSSVGSGIVFSNMKHNVRQREQIFSRFIFANHPEYNKTPIYFNSNNGFDLEGGDVFIYNNQTIVIGVSERTKFASVIEFANSLKQQQTPFTKIYAIEIPSMTNLMHLDTMLTMVDHNKFILAPYVKKEPIHWEIDLKLENKIVQRQELIEDLLFRIIKQKPTVIYVGGNDANYIERAIETHFDATNYLVIRPGVVVGYDRNQFTQKALENAGIIVHSFEGNQLSLGMGSTRCMSMPLFRKDINEK